MKRTWLFLLAIAVAIAFPLKAWADVSLVKTADGTEFKFGMQTKTSPFTLRELDLLGNQTDFKSFISPDIALGDQNTGILNYGNLLFTLERGPLRIHANMEMEVNLDAGSVDTNNFNLERLALYYKIPEWGTLGVGFDVHAFDPEGGLIYTDEHPGIWLVGGTDSISWDVAWHLVTNCHRGASLTGPGGGFCTRGDSFTGPLDTAQASGLLAARVNIAVAEGTTVSPLAVYYRRHVPQASGISESSNPTGDAIGNDATIDFNGTAAGFNTASFSDQFRPGAIVKSDLGPVTLTGELVGLLGQIKDIDSAFLGGVPATAGVREDFDLRSFALFFEAALDGDEIGIPGWTPYFNFEMHSGDGSPFDDTYAAYVPISNLSQALRKDGFKGQSIGSFGPASLGANSEDGWGFDTSARGIGPTLGSIVPDETLGPVCIGGDPVCFNNRGGKASNPGFWKLAGGILGKFAENFDTHLGFNVLWFDTTEAIEAEAAQNCVSREDANPGSTPAAFGCAGSPLSEGDVANAITTMRLGGVDLDQKYMGFEINANIGYNVNAFRIQPYISVFFPGSVVEDIGDAFLSSSTSRFRSKVTAYTMGIELSAAF